MISSCFGGPKGRRFWPWLLMPSSPLFLLSLYEMGGEEEEAQNSQQSDRGEEGRHALESSI